jgi:hypothetical protein
MSMTIRRAEINYESSGQADELRKIRVRQGRRDGERDAHKANGSSVERHNVEAGNAAAVAAAAEATQALARMEQMIAQPGSRERAASLSLNTHLSPASIFENAQRSASTGNGKPREAAPQEAVGEGGEGSPTKRNSGGDRRGDGLVARLIREREEKAAASKILPSSPSPAAAQERERVIERHLGPPGPVQRVPAATRTAVPSGLQAAARPDRQVHPPAPHADLDVFKSRTPGADLGDVRKNPEAHEHVGPYQIQPGGMLGGTGRGDGDRRSRIEQDEDSRIEQIAAMAQKVSSVGIKRVFKRVFKVSSVCLRYQACV